MKTITFKPVTIGLDIAKNVFQVHAVDASGAVLRRRLSRAKVIEFFADLQPCLVGMEACATAHHWGRELMTLGHEVRLMPPAYVKPYVKRGKNDAVDAEACCEAVQRPTMRFVPVKRLEDQAVMTLHRVRDLLIKQRTMLINALRGHLAEFGLVAPKGREGVAKLVAALATAGSDRVPPLARPAFAVLKAEIATLDRCIHQVERAIVGWHNGNELSQLAASAAGVGPITASAVVASVAGDMTRFRSGRHFAAWLGIVPRQTGTGGKVILGPVSKMGNRYLRRLLVLGATSLLRQAKDPKTGQMAWLKAVLDRRPARVAALAQANKTARILWAVLTTGVAYEPTPLAEAA